MSTSRKEAFKGVRSTDIPVGYPALLQGIKQRIRSAQVRATFSANAELVRLYWDIGRSISERKGREGWGAKVLSRLASDLANDLAEAKGFSERNLKLMVQFHDEYPRAFPSARQSVVQLPSTDARFVDRVRAPMMAPVEIGQPLVAQLPWAHNVLLMQKIKDLPTRLWYMQQTITNGWSRNTLALMIDSGAHLRQGKAVTNFPTTLSGPQSDLATQTLKDPYIFDFLTLDQPFQERELETGLLSQLQRFLIELGQGFAFVGRQYRLDVGTEDFYLDLLFYQLRLRCFMVIDLKTGAFKPEFAGKMNFYCNLVDERLRHASDQPTIGLILCQDKNRLVAEYALKGIDKAIGVSGYQLTRNLPRQLRSSLPTIEQIEAELSAPKAIPLRKSRKRRDRE